MIRVREWTRSFEGGELRLRLYPEGFTQHEHDHPWAVINVVLSGLVHETGWNTVQSLRPWWVYSRPAGLRHANRYPHRRTLVLSVLTEPAGETRTDLYRARELCGAVLTHEIVHLVALARGDEAVVGAVDSESIARRIAACPQPGPPVSRVDRARRYLERAGARVDGAAASVAMDRSALRRAFRRHLGLNPSQYRRWTRVREAAVRLAETDEALAGVAAASGFSDQSHMGRDFRIYLGITPRSYRELLSP